MRGRYPIRTVSERTGVNPVTLRAWERRYGLLKPDRTDKGHRLYSEEDIERIRHIVRLLETGVPISQVADVVAPRWESAPVTESDTWRDYRERMLAAVEGFDEAGVEAVYNEALAAYPIQIVIRQLILPLLRTVGRRWADGEGLVAEEHFFQFLVRNKFGAQLHHNPGWGAGPRLICACLPGERHDMGLVLFCLVALDYGMRLIMLGADTPLDELLTVARRRVSDAFVLAAHSIDTAQAVSDGLTAFCRQSELPVFVGGRQAVTHADHIVSAGAIALPEDYGEAVAKIQETLATARMN